MAQDIKLILVVFLAVDTVALLALLFFHLRSVWKQNKIEHYGDRAEKTVRQYITENFPGAVLLNDIFLKSGKGNTQIDHILLCRWGIYVIETKSHNGRIQIAEKQWVQHYGDKVIRFHSPVKQNEVHIKALKQLLSEEKRFSKIPVKGIVVFTSKKVSFSEHVPGVIRLNRLSSAIKGGGSAAMRGPVTARPGRFYLSKGQIRDLGKYILKRRDRNTARRKKHSRTVRRFNYSFNNNQTNR